MPMVPGILVLNYRLPATPERVKEDVQVGVFFFFFWGGDFFFFRLFLVWRVFRYGISMWFWSCFLEVYRLLFSSVRWDSVVLLFFKSMSFKAGFAMCHQRHGFRMVTGASSNTAKYSWSCVCLW